MTIATLVTITDPMQPFSSRKLAELASGNTICQILVDLGYVGFGEAGELVRNGYFIVCLNGDAILQKDWNLVVDEADCLTIQMIPMGGDSSNIATILMTIVMVAAAVYTGGATLAVAAAWGVAAGAAVALMTSLVPTPEMAGSSLGREAASPTYTISAQGNSARLLEAIPVQYGRMRTYPDLAAQPYTENRGNKAILYQLVCLGQGEFDIEKIQIEDSDISGFGEVQYEVVPPGARVTLFPDNVVTSSAVQGLELLGPNEANFAVLGPISVCAPGVKVAHIAVDLTLPQGAWTVNDEGKIRNSSVSFSFEYRLINDAGVAIGPWQPLVVKTLTFATQTTQMLTFKEAVPEGRYQVQAQRTSAAPTNGRSGNKIIWSALRGYVPMEQDYGNVTLIALVITATNNLNSNTARRINVISTAKKPIWDPVNGWSAPVATVNPAWAFADALRNVDYGAKWPSTKLNLAELYRLSLVWGSRGDEFNGVFDKTITLWSALTQILAVGRATPIYYAGVIDAVRDEPKTIPAQRFMPINILENSFKLSYKLGTSQTPDHVIIEYFDSNTWQPLQVPCILPGSAELNPGNATLFGCTNRDQAWREGMYRAAVNRDQRNRVMFTTEMEGLLLRYGDLIKVTHDVPAWGQSGRLLSLNINTGKMTTTEPFIFYSGSHVIAFRDTKGKSIGPFPCTPDANPAEGVFSAYVGGTLAQRQTIPVSDGVNTDFTAYAFGRTDREAANLIVISAKPNNRGETALVCVPYVNSVHIADQGGDVPLPPPISELPNIIVGPVINEVKVLETTVSGQQKISATPASGAVYYEFQAKLGTAAEWVELGVNVDPFMTVNFDAGDWSVRVRAFGSIFGPWTTWTGAISGNAMPIPALVAFAPSSDVLFGINLWWQYAAGSEIAAKVEIWWNFANILGSATKLVDIPYPATAFEITGLGPGDQYFFWIRVVDTAGRVGPWFNNAVAKQGMASTDTGAMLEFLTDQITKTQLAQSLVDEIEAAADSTEIYAAISAEASARTTADAALTSQVNTAQSTANSATAIAQTAQTTIANTNGDLAAMYTIKTQLTVDGKPYMAGIGVGVENTGGILTSQVLISASRFAILDPNAAGSSAFPFILSGGINYLQAAFIQDGTITNAKIGNVIQSTDFVSGVSGWQINKDGTFQMNGNIPGQGKLSITNRAVKVFDSAGTLRVQLGDLSA